jgi:hypothetical protein
VSTQLWLYIYIYIIKGTAIYDFKIYVLTNNVTVTLFFQNYAMVVKPKSRRQIQWLKMGEYGNNQIHEEGK